MIAFIPVNFLAVQVLDHWGLKSGIALGSMLTCIGLSVRCFINYSFIFALIGQTILAVGQPFIYNAPSKLSGNWFGEKERLYSTAFAAYANIIGVALGCFLPSLFVSEGDKDKKDEAKQHIFNMSIILVIISVSVLLPTLLTFHSNPPSPPSHTFHLDPATPLIHNRNHQTIPQKTSLKDDMKQLLKNKDFLLTSIANSLIIGYFFVLTSVL